MMKRSVLHIPKTAAATTLRGLLLLGLLLLGMGCESRVDVAVGGADEGAGPRAPVLPVPPQPMHRLNRLEYNNTVRDLLGTTLRPADAFPPDGEADGFDNNAQALQLTPALLDNYFTAARDVVADALDDRPAFRVTFDSEDIGAVVPGGYPVGDLWALSGQAAALVITVPEGSATVRVVLGASQIGPAPAPQLRLEVNGVPVETFTVPGSAAALQTREHTVAFVAGSHTIRYVATNFINDAPANISNNVLVQSISVESQARVEGAGRARLIPCDPETDAACPAAVVERFAQRAWRRPLLPAEQTELLALLERLRADGEPAEDAIRLVMRSVLTSPKFLYRARTTGDADTDEWLDDFTLASRLSYFLWSSMPDERLFVAAERGELSSVDGVRAVVAWMLEDERAQGLKDGFAEQWLSTRLLKNVAPSPTVFPTWNDALRDDMAAEAKAFFGDFLSNGLPVSSFLLPDFAYRTERLAAHYGTRPVVALPGETLVRTPVGPGERRGVFSLGSWLVTHSDAEHSSPIRRGRWISDAILCEPVPPPPADLVIAPIAPGEDGEGIRQALERHRSEQSCATCHNQLDVIGMGFELYDGVGRPRREADLDTLGELPGGVTFEDPEELASVLDETLFVTCITQKLFTYAAGRSVESYDRIQLEAIAKDAVDARATLPELLTAIVTSPAFRAPAVLQETP